MDDWQILLQLKEALGGGNGLHTIEEVFKAMAASVPAFAGLTLSRIGDLGRRTGNGQAQGSRTK